MPIAVLSADQVRRLVPMPDAIEGMRSAFAQISSGEAVLPVRTSVDTGSGVTFFMPGFLPRPRALGGKIASVRTANRARDLPVIQAVVILIDDDTGAPRAIMEGTALTGLRTGAATGLATDLLARPDAAILAVFGAGAQARTQIEAVRCVRPIHEIRLVSRTRRSAEALARELRSGADPPEVRVLEDRAEAVEGASVVVTATDSHSPVFPGEAVSAGAHVNGIGSFKPHMQEVDEAFVVGATVIVDSREAALSEAGDLLVPMRAGLIGADHVRAELGEVVEGVHPGRTRTDEVTFFKSVGNAAQDLAVGALALELAERLGVARTLVEF